MASYLLIWDINDAFVPVDPKERGEAYNMLLAMVKNDMEKGITKGWGTFIGERTGYCVVEGSELEIMNLVQQYTPYVTFETHACASVDLAQEMVNALIGT